MAEDRRIQRTKALLRNSILELSLEREYDALTIENITEHANLGRTTFYLHYRDKGELLADSLNNMLDEIFTRVYSLENIHRWRHEGIDPRRELFVYVEKNADLFKKLFCGNLGGIAIIHLQSRLANKLQEIIELWQKKNNLVPMVDNEITSAYGAGALTGMISAWLQTGMKLGAEEMYEKYHHLMRNGLVESTGIGSLLKQKK